MRPRYSYWSVATGEYAALLEHCVRTARAAGVFKEFHALTDRPLEGCECYDAYECDKAHGLFKLHYLKVGMSRLNFDYFVWLDADTVFVRNPVDLLGALGKSPIHVPLEVDLSTLDAGHIRQGAPVARLRELFKAEGLMDPLYVSGSAFWIVHHDAIETVYDLALGFWHKAKAAGLSVKISAALGYAMQLLCADPEAHRLTERPDLWGSDGVACSENERPDGEGCGSRQPPPTAPGEVRSAMIHLAVRQRKLPNLILKGPTEEVTLLLMSKKELEVPAE
jgi:hypothetical protein